MINFARRHLLKRGGLALVGAGSLASTGLLRAQKNSARPAPAPPPPAGDCNCTLAADGTPLDTGTSELRPVIERYSVELRDYERLYPLAGSAARKAAFEKFYESQLRLLDGIRFDNISQAGKVDYLLIRDRLLSERKAFLADRQREAEIAPLIPFQQTIIGFEEARRRMDTMDGQQAAISLEKLLKDIAAARDSLSGAKGTAAMNRAAQRLQQLRGALRSWYDFYALYDPKFVWWVEAGFKKADEALEAHAQFLHTTSGVGGPLGTAGPGGRGGGGRGDNAGRGGDSGGGGARRSAAPLGSEEEISGAGPAGRDALMDALRRAMIVYTPEQLVTLANREFVWCDKEMLRASNEMGCGNDWKKALETVKNKYVEPGQMIYLVRDLAREAIEFVEKHELVTIPDLVKQDYWEEAITPEGQLVSPFFLGGAVIRVSSPASSQTIEQRLETLRGNNIYFARATVFHELIPGHHMQQYMTQRYRAYRSLFATPFWTEGMAFYWEMLLWDLGFTHTPEQRVGALFWRMHRCARIIFSLSFHLGKMKATECVQFLIDRVGFEKANAEGEVRRSFNGSYEPIYQCAYMLGALQFYALHKELVDSGRMTNRAFHDALYQQGDMPVEMVRLAINGQKVDRNYQPAWKFYGEIG
ncbi:MAG TPA: DUF885 family protein [Verrucomicrobiae bacterium]|nr:DUF885 family protein [Verrucomicrobiae bacterium]